MTRENKLYILDQILVSAFWASLITSLFFLFQTGSLFSIPLIMLGALFTSLPLLFLLIFPFCAFLFSRKIFNVLYWLTGIVFITFLYGVLMAFLFDAKSILSNGSVYGGAGLCFAFILYVRIKDGKTFDK